MRREFRHRAIAMLLTLLLHLLVLTLTLGPREGGHGSAGEAFRDRRAGASAVQVTLPAIESGADGPVTGKRTASDPRLLNEQVPVTGLVLLPSDPASSGNPPSDAAPVDVPQLAPPQPARSSAEVTEKAEAAPVPVVPTGTVPVVSAPADREDSPSARREAEEVAKEQMREAAERREAQRLEAQRVEAQRLEAQRQLALRQEAARAAAARTEQAAARAELERQEIERALASEAEAQRAQAERLETERREAARLTAPRPESARQETPHAEAFKLEAAKLEAAKLDAAKLEEQRRELARQAQAQPLAAQSVAEQAEAEREARLRAIGRQLDSEAAQRREAAKRAGPAALIPIPSRSARRVRVWGRVDSNSELIKYVESWERKIQFNTPTDTVARVARRMHQQPLVTVAVRSNGSVESVTFVTSSGSEEVDQAIRDIVQSHEYYPPFPPALVRDFDVIEIRRTWQVGTSIQFY